MNERLQYFYEVFDVQENCSVEELQKAATTSVALDKLGKLLNMKVEKVC